MDVATHSGSGVVSRQYLLTGVLVLLVVLAGCSVMSNEAEEEMMELMNHTATGMQGANVSMNDTVATGDVITKSELVTFKNQTTNGSTVTIRSVRVPDGGYVSVYTPRFTEDRIFSAIGVSDYLEPGTHRNVTVTLYEIPGRDFGDDTHLMGQWKLLVVPHRETSGDRTFDHITTGLNEDGPYRNETGAIGVSTAMITSNKEMN